MGGNDGWGRRGQVAGLLLLAPVCAEYLSAYDDSTGHVGRLVGNLVVFLPLYGCPALIIREVARRAGIGWVGIITLATAFGLVQAGLVDQSLFSTDYRAIDGWDATFRATAVPALGLSAFNSVNFVTGHVIFSSCAPIALVEAARPQAATTPWVGRPGLVAAALAYVGASVLVLHDSLTTEDSHASLIQVLVTSALVGGLILAAFRWTRRPTAPAQPAARAAPRVVTVAGVALVLSVVYGTAPETWLGVGLMLAASVAAALGLVRAARTVGWSVRHVAIVAAAPLIVRAALAFGYYPLVGDVSAPAKYGHNVAMLVVVLVATGCALRPHRTQVEDGSP